MLWCVSWLLLMASDSVLSLSGQANPRHNFLKFTSEDKSSRNHPDFNGSNVIRSLLIAKSLDNLGGGEILRILDPLTGGMMLRTLDTMGGDQMLKTLDNFRGGEVLGVLDKLTGGDLISTLDATEGMMVLAAIEKATQSKTKHMSSFKRNLDTLTGMAFGESKRFDSLSGSTFGMSKRDFDEIDNVGFTGFAKRPWNPSSKVAKKNFDEIDRAGFETYNKRNFDEIDRAGFETFEKRNRKE